MKVGFTGTRGSISPEQIQAFRALLLKLRPSEFHHGDCVGSDATAHSIARALHILIVLHPPDDPTWRAFSDGATLTMPPLPYLKRNRQIVHLTEGLIGVPLGAEITRSGTWSTIRHARQLERPVWIIWRDGKVTKERMT